jgi:hypothetical protein
VVTSRHVGRGDVPARRRAGVWWLLAAIVYASAMIVRLGLGLTLLKEVRWFASPVPTAFHLVLAAYLFTYGLYHHRHG